MTATNKTALRRRSARRAGRLAGIALAAAFPVLAAAAPAHAVEEPVTASSTQAVAAPTAPGEDDGTVSLPVVGDTLADVVDDLVNIHDWG